MVHSAYARKSMYMLAGLVAFAAAGSNIASALDTPPSGSTGYAAGGDTGNARGFMDSSLNSAASHFKDDFIPAF